MLTVSQLKHAGDIRAADHQGNLVLERSRRVDVAPPLDRAHLVLCGALFLYRCVDIEAKLFEYAGRTRPLPFNSQAGYHEAGLWLGQLASERDQAAA